MTVAVKKLSVSKLKVSEVMKRDVFCLSADLTVKRAIRLLVDHQISGAPLILPNTQIMLSVVSEADLIKFAAMDGLEKTIHEFLDKLPRLEDMVTARADDSFGELFKKFLFQPVRRVIVLTANGHVDGIVSRRDIMAAFIEEADK